MRAGPLLESIYAKYLGNRSGDTHRPGPPGFQRISLETYKDPSQIRQLWRDFERSGCYAFQKYDFAAEWCHTVAPALGMTPRIFVVYLGSTPLILFPMCIAEVSSLRILEFIDGGVSDYNAPVLSRHARVHGIPDFNGIWTHMLQSLTDVDGIRLRRMPSDILGIPNPMLQLPGCGSDEAGYYLDLDNGFAAARGLLKEAAKKRRRLCRSHEVSVKEGIDEAATLNLLIQFRESKYKWNQSRKGEIVKFYRNLISRSDMVRMFRLCVDGKTVAAQYAVASGTVCTGLITGYDPRWAEFSPGKILTARMIECLRENGFSEFDSGYGEEDYKREFSSHRRALSFFSKGISIKGKVFLSTYWTARSLYRSLRAL